MVIKRLFFVSFKFLLIKAWWDQVTVRPDETRIIVLSKGISKGLNGIIPLGGHDCPISILGAREE